MAGRADLGEKPGKQMEPHDLVSLTTSYILSNIWFNILVSKHEILIHFRLGAKDSSYLYGMGSQESYCDLRPSHGDSGRDRLGAMDIHMPYT